VNEAPCGSVLESASPHHSLPSPPCLHSTSLQHLFQHEGSAEVLEACLCTDVGGFLFINESKARPHMHIHENQAQKQGTARKITTIQPADEASGRTSEKDVVVLSSAWPTIYDRQHSKFVEFFTSSARSSNTKTTSVAPGLMCSWRSGMSLHAGQHLVLSVSKARMPGRDACVQGCAGTKVCRIQTSSTHHSSQRSLCFKIAVMPGGHTCSFSHATALT